MKLILIYGVPGTGKHTIAKELASLTGFTLFHNHMILNLLSEIFGYEHPTRRRLEKEFRLRIIEEAVKANINMIVTGIIMRDNEDFYKNILTTVEKANSQCLLVHLTVSQETLHARIDNDSRKAMNKISSSEKLDEWFKKYPESLNKISYDNQLTVDTSNISPEEAAEEIIKHFHI